jgi:GNAT superfamily N-acetyltransferase
MFLHRLLEPDDDVAGFDCGAAPLDQWLTSTAHRAHRQRVVRVYVWVAESDPHRVVAYSAIQPTQILAATLTRGQSGGHGAVPGYLIARLALDRSLQGQGMGTELLARTLQTCVAAAAISGGRLVAVDPIDEAARDFYVAHGFTGTKGGDRLVMKVATAAAEL